MKIRTPLLAALFAIVSMGAFAADAEKAPTAKVKPHSHMQEKTGIAPSDKQTTPTEETATATAATTTKADKDKSKHFHPRDGK